MEDQLPRSHGVCRMYYGGMAFFSLSTIAAGASEIYFISIRGPDYFFGGRAEVTKTGLCFFFLGARADPNSPTLHVRPHLSHTLSRSLSLTHTHPPTTSPTHTDTPLRNTTPLTSLDLRSHRLSEKRLAPGPTTTTARHVVRWPRARYMGRVSLFGWPETQNTETETEAI